MKSGNFDFNGPQHFLAREKPKRKLILRNYFGLNNSIPPLYHTSKSNWTPLTVFGSWINCRSYSNRVDIHDQELKSITKGLSDFSDEMKARASSFILFGMKESELDNW